MNRVSAKRMAENAEYDLLRRDLLKIDEPWVFVPCAAGELLRQQGVAGCTGRATELHHKRKRSSGGAISNPANVVATCHTCNVYGIEDHPIEAHAAGLVVREDDPEWESLGARAWRMRCLP